jgi:hypothetical protein
MNAEREGRQLVIPEAIRSLLEQRARYMEWLAKLDDLGGQYRPEVARRVRGDYQERLTGVEDELHGHQAELESSLAERQSRLGELEQRHDACAAELEEIELRHQVGEFDDSEWEDRKSEREQELRGIVEELDVERDAVEELGSVLVQVTAPSEAAATRHVEPGAWVEPAADVGFARSAETAGPEAAEEPADDGLELAEEPATAIDEETASEGDGDEDAFLDELEFLESLSLDDPESFDAVSKMLEDESDGHEGESEKDRGGAG